MNNQNVYILEDRGILYINGADAKEFLQNMISNDINKVSEDSSCFASLLTPQGKFLFAFIIIKHKSGYFIDCEKSQTEALFKQLSVYKLRSKVEIMNLSNEFVVAAFNKEKFLEFEGSKDIAGNTIKYREDSILLDPRNKDLGARLIINLEKLYLSLKKLELKDSPIAEYYKLSHQLGIPQKNMNELQNKLFGIECNFEELNGIDFKKGCYVGQENTARIKLKNKLSKRLLPIYLIEGEINQDDLIYNGDFEIGKVLISNEYPFALIKYLDDNFNQENEFKSKNAKLKIKIPSWIN
ncbi:YgfZ/GcvT domain-containing protein [Candidatus Pelagibacter communis]|jgi:folate-binding protein YgfZ|uniref:GcvT-like Aminomethyltransferase protein n=1 Tax=Pelagibacter ubique (strain HTCC1062) TaxID=335992 RepID=Q4FMZ7_PELUB|nr:MULTISPECIES: folate-binding protein YgfZ [Pelagibacter]AAZ21442.1 GcvT-like Aminomethyltransferase protein [Candidatus Pelagibacter ubique HTCC1062]MDA8844294.1 folate-binding protein YgfZ [Candidatus Pelagibacter bacterium]